MEDTKKLWISKKENERKTILKSGNVQNEMYVLLKLTADSRLHEKILINLYCEEKKLSKTKQRRNEQKIIIKL